MITTTILSLYIIVFMSINLIAFILAGFYYAAKIEDKNEYMNKMDAFITSHTYITSACQAILIAIIVFHLKLSLPYIIGVVALFLIAYITSIVKVTINKREVKVALVDKDGNEITDLNKKETEKKELLEKQVKEETEKNRIRYKEKATKCIIFIIFFLIPWILLSYKMF